MAMKLHSSFIGDSLPFFSSCQKTQKSNSCSKLPTIVKSEWQELVGVLVFSTIPFVSVKALAQSEFGSFLQNRAEKEKNKYYATTALSIEKEREREREKSFWYGTNRPKWLGPLPFNYPNHLKGELPGDYGFDILSLSVRPSDLDRYFNLEILHARWAMLSALGVLVPEVLQKWFGLEFAESVWWKVGEAKLKGDTLDYLGIEGLYIAGGQGIIIIAIAQFLLMLGPELARSTGIDALLPVGIFLPGDENYPAGFLFDPLGLAKDAKTFEDLKVKEIKNGRLAMVAWLGFFVQAYVTRDGPLQNLIDFIQNPIESNILSHL